MYLPAIISVIVYISALLFGAAMTTLLLISLKRENTLLNKMIFLASISLLFYCIFEFFGYALMKNGGHLFVKGYILFSDGCYFVFVAAWLSFLLLMCDKGLSAKAIGRITILYALVSEAIVLIFLQYNAKTDTMIIAVEPARLTLLSIDMLYVVFVLVCSLRCVFLGARKMERGGRRKAVFIFGSLLSLYMFWTLIWDYNAVAAAGNEIETIFLLDPLVLIYICLNVAIIYFFFRSDYLQNAIGNKAVQAEEECCSWEDLQQEYHLTPREAEVMCLCCAGKSNPDIGKELFIAENTVKRHLNNVFKKTGTKNRYELLSLAGKVGKKGP